MTLVLQAVVFDFDGTLARLTIDFDEMRFRVREEARRAGLAELPEERRPVLEWIEAMVGHHAREGRGAAAQRFAERARASVMDLELAAAARAELFDFTRPMLGALRRSGVKTAIITRNCSQAVRIVQPDVEACCDALVARDQTPRVKPDPAHPRLALARVGVTPERGAMVGDHPLDIATGRAAGMFTAGVASGRVAEEELARHGADLTAPDCGKLMDRLRALGLLPSER